MRIEGNRRAQIANNAPSGQRKGAENVQPNAGAGSNYELNTGSNMFHYADNKPEAGAINLKMR